MPRSRLIYRRFDLSGVPAAHRARALQIKLEAWQPLASVRFWTGWQQGTAQVWAWAAGESGLQPAAGERPLPEPLAYAPMQKGTRLVRCVEGFEGQFWLDGVLRQSRWWAVEPAAKAWQTFLRSAGLPPADVPHPEQPPASAQPWARAAGSQAAWWVEREMRWVASAAAMLALLIGWQAGGWWNAQRALQHHERQLEQLQQSAATPLAARERALTALTRIEQLHQRFTRRTPLELLDEVTAGLPEGITLHRWQQQQESLVFEIEGQPPPDPETTVRALQHVAGLEQIIVERGRQPNLLELSAVLVPRSP